MSNFYLCDTCENKGNDLTLTMCLCCSAPIEKIVVSDDDNRQLNEICKAYERCDDQ